MNDHEHDALIERVSKALEVPDPSPLFWKHFPDRVRAAVHEAPAASPFGWWRRRAGMLTISMAAAAVLATATFFRNDSGGFQTPASIAVEATAPLDGIDDMEADPDWAAVSAIAASAGPEMLREAGFHAAPGSAEAAIADLDDDQRADLVAMIRAEMKGDD